MTLNRRSTCKIDVYLNEVFIEKSIAGRDRDTVKGAFQIQRAWKTRRHDSWRGLQSNAVRKLELS